MIAKRYCASISCPRMRDVSLPYPGELSQDKSGHFWCDLCAKQRAVMDWAADQNWPHVRVQGKMVYAVYSDAFNWYTSVAGANEDMTTALYEVLIERKREPLPTDVKPPGVARVAEFFKIVDDE